MTERRGAHRPGTERRRSVRLTADFPIRTVSADGEQAITTAGQISEGGLFIEYILPYAPGTELELHFRLPGQGEVHAHGVVASVEHYFDPAVLNRKGNGLRFLRFEADGAERVRAWIRQELGL